MSAPAPSVIPSVKSRIETLVALARLLERVEANADPVGADQYRALVSRLKTALVDPLPDAALKAILGAHPATAELYENLHYESSGLSQSGLERSVETEMLAARAIARAAKRGA